MPIIPSIANSKSIDSSHYFFAVPRNFALEDVRVDRSILEDITSAFGEDRRIVEAQHRNIDWNQPMLPISADLALTHYRRIFDELLEIEARQQVSGPIAMRGVK